MQTKDYTRVTGRARLQFLLGMLSPSMLRDPTVLMLLGSLFKLLLGTESTPTPVHRSMFNFGILSVPPSRP